MSDITKIVGERLRNKRNKMGWSQEYVAELANLHPTYIGQVERGEKNATLESIEKICLALQLPMEDLFMHVIPANTSLDVANQCYHLISLQPLKDQKSCCKLSLVLLIIRSKKIQHLNTKTGALQMQRSFIIILFFFTKKLVN